MKIRTIAAASAIAATATIGGVSQSASACGITLTVDNDENYSVTIDWNLSKVRAAPFGVAGTWASLGSGSTTLDADTSGGGDDVDRAFNLGPIGCGTGRQYRLYVTGGGNSGYEYHNEVGPTGTWTTDPTPFIDIE